MGNREIRINYLKDILNFNKVDIFYLIDVENYNYGIFLNGYDKYDDGKDFLLIINEKKENFIIDKDNMIIKNAKIKFVFTYLTPNSDNPKQIKILRELIKDIYPIFWDFNYELNFKYLHGHIDIFAGEDTIRYGLLSRWPIILVSLDSPSAISQFCLFLIRK